MNRDLLISNLKKIREEQQLSQEQVAERSGLSRGAYRNIEGGQAQPRMRNLEAIARALSVPVGELFEPTLTLTQVRFRSHKRLRTRGQILTRAARWLSDYHELEVLLGRQRPFKLKGVIAQLSGEDRAITAAQLTRAALGLTAHEPIRDICGLLDAAGVKVLSLPIASDAFFGLSIGMADQGPAVVVNTWERLSVESWIFSAAHELGHLLLHLADYDHAQDEVELKHEREADRFASELLMPDAVFQQAWAESAGLPLVPRVIKLKRMFRVSYQTVLRRLAPSYQGNADDIWAHFYTDYHQRTGRTLSRADEPVTPEHQLIVSMPDALRSQEPDHLSSSDFHEDRLSGLVRSALESGEISFGRGAEILGISLKALRTLSSSWIA